MKQGGVLKARYQYLTDGTKLSVRDGSGKNGYDYAGSFIYKVADGKREFDRAIVGDVQFTSQGIRYALTDQLGSIRALIDDKGKVVQQNDFYPFGAKAERDGLAQAEDNRFLFSGKECQALIDLNAYDFGARMYDASLGRWTAVDLLAEKYMNISTYGYCIGNPIKYIDINGKYIAIWYYNENHEYSLYLFDGNILDMIAKVGSIDFIFQFALAYIYNTTNGGGDMLLQAALDRDHIFTILETEDNTCHTTYEFKNTPQDKPVVKWNSLQGLETEEGYRLSPATALEHEMAHHVRSVTTDDYKAFRHDTARNTDPQYGTIEERRVITTYEAKTAQANGEFPKKYKRKSHKGIRFKTYSSTSNEIVEYFK